MIKEHCMIEGKRCSKCCEVLTLKETKNFREWRAYAKKWGDISQHVTYKMVTKISKRRAKKINPLLVSVVGNNQAYFTCKNLTKNGCGIYEDRPYMCSGFPYYGLTQEEYLSSPSSSPLYTENCTYNIKL